MRIDKKDFLDIENSNQIVNILEQMLDLDNYDLNELIYELDNIISDKNDKVIFVIFPYLVDIALQTRRIEIVDFLSTLKVRGLFFDMNRLSNKEIYDYIVSLYKINASFDYNLSKDTTKDWNEDFKTYYMKNCLFLHTFSTDIVSFLDDDYFSGRFNVRCKHCSDDTNTLQIPLINLEKVTDIKPRNLEDTTWDGLFFDDIYVWFYNCLKNADEKYFSRKLPYIYGTYTCPICKSENTVIGAIKEYIFKDNKIFIPTKDYINRIVSMIKNDDWDSWILPNEKWFLTTYAISMYNQLYGKGNLDSYILALETALDLMTFKSIKFMQKIAENIMKEIKYENEYDEKIARIYTLCGVSYSYDYDNKSIDCKKKALNYFKKAMDINVKLYGKNHEETHKSITSYLLKKVDIDKKYFDELEDYLKYFESSEIATEEDIARLKHLIADKYFSYKEYDKAIRLDKEHLKMIEKEYGKDSDIVADYITDLAEGFEEGKDLKNALKYYEKSINIKINNVKKEYKLDNINNEDIYISLNKISKKDSYFNNRALSIGESFFYIGNINYKMKKFNKSLTNYNKSLELFSLVENFYANSFIANSHHKLAKTYLKLNDNKKALYEFEKSLEKYNIIIEFDDEEEILDIKPDLEELTKDILKFKINTDNEADFYKLYSKYTNIFDMFNN